MIISTSYFKGDIHIAGIQDVAPNIGRTGKLTMVNNLIDKYEVDVLVRCLGFPLYIDFQSNLEIKQGATLQSLKETAHSKWNDLLNGKVYTTQKGNKVVWRGIIFKSGNLHRSFIANYVFCKFVDNESEKMKQLEIVEDYNLNNKYVSAWNEFFHMVVKGRNGERSLSEFITDMNAIDSNTYPDFQFNNFKKINTLGI